MITAMKTRLSPSREQNAEFEQCISAQRFYWNQLLQMWNEVRESGQKRIFARSIRDLFRVNPIVGKSSRRNERRSQPVTVGVDGVYPKPLQRNAKLRL